MTDDELQERLRRLASPTGAEPDWNEMVRDVRTEYEAATAPRPLRRRRRWLVAPVAATLALAAALALYVKLHHPPAPSGETSARASASRMSATNSAALG